MTSEGPLPPEETPEPPATSDNAGQPLTSPNLGRPAPEAPATGLTPPNLGETAKTGMSGCAIAAIIGGAIILVVGIVLVAVLVFGFMRFSGDVEESFSEEPCPYISSEEASDSIGTEVEATSGDSALGAILGLIRDTRLLGDAPSCFITNEDSTIQIWISVYDGSDAAEVFAAEADVADGQVITEETTESGSITVESDPFRGDDVSGLGEEAFCVEVGAVVSGGVFVRSEDRVVFVSALAAGENGGAGVLDGSTCERALPIAAALLGQ